MHALRARSLIADYGGLLVISCVIGNKVYVTSDALG